MNRWLLLILAVVLIGVLWPWLSRIGLGRLPGDLRLQRRGRTYYFPIASTLLLSLLLALLGRLFKL
ncbi:MAG TPA: DUF2905 domain-containing protein [Usitatibacteraceae bacterium]|nr:DUF2905 domain-containing protein [Usitatibacteraceae bacterium]